MVVAIVAMSKKCTPLRMWKSKCTKHLSVGALLEVALSKKCTPLWREAHFEVKSAKKLRGTEHFWTFRCRFAWQEQGIVMIARLVKSKQKREG